MINASTLVPGNTLLVSLKLGLALEIRTLGGGKFDRAVPVKKKVAEEWDWTKVIGTLSKYENGFLYMEVARPQPKRPVPYNGPAFSTVIHYSAVKSAFLLEQVNHAPKTHVPSPHHVNWDMHWLPYQRKWKVAFP